MTHILCMADEKVTRSEIRKSVALVASADSHQNLDQTNLFCHPVHFLDYILLVISMLVVSFADMMRGAEKMMSPANRDIFHPCPSSCNPYRCKCIL